MNKTTNEEGIGKCMIYDCKEETHFGYYYCSNHQKQLPNMELKDACYLLEFSMRAHKAILATGKEKLCDIIFMSDQELSKMKNIGEKTLEEIRNLTDELFKYCTK